MENIHIHDWTSNQVEAQISKFLNGAHVSRKLIRTTIMCLNARKSNDQLVRSILCLIYVIVDNAKWKKKFYREGLIDCLYRIWGTTNTKGNYCSVASESPHWLPKQFTSLMVSCGQFSF